MADQHVEGDTIPETDKKRLLPYSNIIDVSVRQRFPIVHADSSRLRPIPEQATDFAIRVGDFAWQVHGSILRGKCRFFDAVLDGKFKVCPSLARAPQRMP